MYRVKELFYTVQGEGLNAGTPAVFLRFSGCNLWSGRPGDRGLSCSAWCDTDFLGTDGPGGGVFADPGELADAVGRTGPVGLLVCTGGEPLLQLDFPLVRVLRDRGWTLAVETNGTHPVPPGFDHVCVSPKVGAKLRVHAGAELKLVWPQPGIDPEQYPGLDFRHFFLQPLGGPAREANTRACVEYVLGHPRWKLSLQTHKFAGLR